MFAKKQISQRTLCLAVSRLKLCKSLMCKISKECEKVMIKTRIKQ